MKKILWATGATLVLLTLGCSSTSSNGPETAAKAASTPANGKSNGVTNPAALRLKKPASPKVTVADQRKTAQLESASRGYRGVHGSWPNSAATLRKWLRESKQSDRFLDELPNLTLVTTKKGALVLTWGSDAKARQSLYVAPQASRVRRPIEKRVR